MTVRSDAQISAGYGELALVEMPEVYLLARRNLWRSARRKQVPQRCRSFRESATFEVTDEGIGFGGWMRPGRKHPFDSTSNHGWGEVHQMAQESVGMSGRDLEARQHVFGEVALVERDDDLGLCADRGGQDVAVVGVWKLQSRNQRVEPGNAGVGQRGIHGRTALFELFGRDVRSGR